jgi:hypothetical protein
MKIKKEDRVKEIRRWLGPGFFLWGCMDSRVYDGWFIKGKEIIS